MWDILGIRKYKTLVISDLKEPLFLVPWKTGIINIDLHIELRTENNLRFGSVNKSCFCDSSNSRMNFNEVEYRISFYTKAGKIQRGP
jgi:hypothetical protein